MDIDNLRRRGASGSDEPSSSATSAEATPRADGRAATRDAGRSGAREHLPEVRDDGVALRFVQARPPRPGDGVLYVGMNSHHDQNVHEANALRASGPGVRRIVGHGENEAGVGADRARLGGGKVVDLATREGAEEFAGSLGLPPAQTATVARVVHGGREGSRDELAKIAKVFAEAERGKDIPSRFVISGHSTGTTAYDEGPGNLGGLRFSDVFALADAMPRAAAQIEDVMLSACSTGFEDEPGKVPLTSWKEHFPNLKTAWGYGRSDDVHSPTGKGAVKHVKGWEQATRGRKEHLSPRAAIARANEGPAGHERNVSIWTVRQGYVQGR